MKKSVQCSRIFVSFALVFCMLFGMMNIVNADISVTLYPLGSNSRTTRTITPERQTIKIYLSDGMSGSAVKRDSLPSWVTVSSSTSYYIANVQANTSTSARSGSVVFTKGNKTYELYLTQNSFKIKTTSGEGSNVSSVNFRVAGETKKLYASYSCTLSGTIPKWLTVTPSSDGKTFTLTADPNPNGSKRTCTLYFTKTLSSSQRETRVVTIYQSPNSITGVPSSIAFTKRIGQNQFTVTTGYGTVTAKNSSNADWLYVFQKGNTITVRCTEPNYGGSPRTAYVQVKVGDITKTITVKQA